LDAEDGLMGFPMKFVDLQVNGYAGVDFNGDALDAERVDAASARMESEGVEGMLVTIITDAPAAMEARLRSVVKLRESVPSLRRIMRGFHIEGPFLNPEDGYRGAHPLDAIRKADVAVMERLLEAGAGMVRVVTLAPEMDEGMRVTRMLAGRNIVVSAGHTNASLDELHAALHAGLSMFTHFGNGCPGNLPRHDNILNRVMSLRGKLWVSFIADGAHVPFYVLKNYLDWFGTDKSLVVTDAISAAGLGPGSYRLGRWELAIGEDGVARSPDGSHLVGSTATMMGSYRNLVEKVRLSEADALNLVDRNPRKVLGG
jgi:N-acetylglucosamine-6-phosphate deacetylase